MSRVLLVDDEEDLLAMLEAALRFEGFDVSTATNGLEAVEAIAAHDYDVIVLDVMLPGMDGLAVCGQIRSEGVETPVLFLSARDSAQDIVQGLALGDDYLTKPFSLRVLVARLRALLRRTSEYQPGCDRDGG